MSLLVSKRLTAHLPYSLELVLLWEDRNFVHIVEQHISVRVSGKSKLYFHFFEDGFSLAGGD
jgi:hypothetical protein